MTKIHPSAVVAKEAVLGEDVVIGPNCVVNSGAEIGPGTVLDANVVIGDNVTIGRENHFYPNCVIGSRPQILGLSPEARIGGLVIGNGNHVREQVTIHPSMHEDMQTSLGNDNFLMVGSHVGHDCTLEDLIVMSNCVQLSGHCKIETGVWLSGLAGTHQFVTVGKWCYVAGLAGVNKDVPPFLTVSGHYPQRIRGVNKRGLRRAGLSEEKQDRIIRAYRRLYREGGALLKNAEALAREDDIDENVQAMIDSITRSSRHQFGRHLETFRNK